MSILDRFKYVARVKPDDERWGKLRADFPVLADALLGWLDEDGKSVHPGGTLMIFRDDGNLKWTFHHKASQTTLFGSFPDTVLALEDVESAMAEGRYETKKGR